MYNIIVKNLNVDLNLPGHGVLVVLEVQPQVCMLILTLPVGNHLYKHGINILFKNLPPIPILSAGNNPFPQFNVKK